MNQRSINYYGYGKDTYEECRELIRTTNWIHVLVINSWFVANNLMYLIFSVLGVFGVDKSRIPFFVSFLILSALFEFCLLFFRQKLEAYSILTIYISIVLLLTYGIMKSISQPYLAAVIFLVLLAAISLSYIDCMLRMGLVLTGYGIVFLLSSFSQKAISIAYSDSYNIATVLILTLILHYMFQHTRMTQFVLYQNNLRIQRELEVKSSFDALTSLLNRGRFFAIAEDIMQNSKEEYIAICLLDLDGFKQVNDKLGHQMGDKVIQTAGETIVNTLGIDFSERWSFAAKALKERYSLAGRLGGDEFIIMLRNMKNKEEITGKLEELLHNLNSVRFEGLDGIHASFGVTILSSSDYTLDSAYTRADEALYRSKKAGKNQIHFSMENN